MSYFLRRLLLKDSKSNRSLTLTPTHFSAAAFSSDAAEEREARLERGSKETRARGALGRKRIRSPQSVSATIRFLGNWFITFIFTKSLRYY